MVFVLIALVVGGLVAVAVLAVGAALDGRRDRGERSTAPTVLVVGAVGMVVVLGLGALVLIGVDGPGGRPSPTAPVPTTTPLREGQPPHEPTPPRPSPLLDAGPALPVIVVAAADPDRFAPYEVADALEPDSVVRVRATGYEKFERGRVEHCVVEVARPPSCTPPFPVQFGKEGRAEFQFQLRSSLVAGECRAGGPTCSLRVSGVASGRQGSVQTVFTDHVVTGQVAVQPASGIVDGEEVVVAVAGLAADATFLATLCGPPGGYDPMRCRTDGGTARLRTRPDGSGETTLVIRTGEVGGDGVQCGPRRGCGVTVVGDRGFVSSATTRIAFSRGANARYDLPRLAGGVAVAAALVVLALVLIRRTDWRPPSEAAAPAVDDADLQTGLSLDELFGSDEDLDAKDPVGF